jgi:hypothetical protein
MIKIYSNQEKPDVIPMVDSVITNDTEWWMIYDANTLQVLVPPLQCAGGTSCVYTMVITDTLEEMDQYIQDNNLLLPLDPDSSFPTDNIQ